MSEIAFVVDADESGRRLDVVVAARAGLSRTMASSLKVLVNDASAMKSLRVEQGMRVSVSLPAEVVAPFAEPIDLEVVFEDDDLIVVNKEAGLVVHPAPGHQSGTLVNALLARANIKGGAEFRPGIVHRLDAGTSGLIVVAKSIEAFDALTKMISERTVTRGYIALVEGTPTSSSATIDAPIGRSVRNRKKMGVVEGGREAITHYEITETMSETSLLSIKLETGRTHQIRVHLSEIGHPVVGDPIYGRSRSLDKRLRLTRPFLHAATLSFAHPITHEQLNFEVPLPSDLQTALELARPAG
ncbi:MAG: RluA family pseudouridine synthase [Actinomycetota bacterium]